MKWLTKSDYLKFLTHPAYLWLQKHNKEHEFHSYPDAGHGFFSVDYPNFHRDSARDGWKQIWDFYGRHLSEGAPEGRILS